MDQGDGKKTIDCEELTNRVVKKSRSMLKNKPKLANECYQAGHTCLKVDRPDLAQANFQLAVDLSEHGAATKSKASNRRQTVLAASLNHLGLIALHAEDGDAATRFFDRAIQTRRTLQGLFPDDRENQVYLGGALCNRGHAAKTTDPSAATMFYEESLQILRQERTCECSYYDEERQTWNCEQLEAIGNALGLAWVFQGPLFIDHAMAGLKEVQSDS